MADDRFTLLGDAVWLDFVNTARARVTPPPDLLSDFDAWRRWTAACRLDAGGAPAGFPAIVRLRARLTELAEALHAERPAPGGSIAAINEILARRPGREQLTRVSGRWRLQFAPAQAASGIESIARSAAATLADPLTRVRRCGGRDCSLFFTDDSPAGSRRWCDVQVCGRGARVERRRGILR
jgi:predicted RNA-binding Zn ribbon-like protein